MWNITFWFTHNLIWNTLFQFKCYSSLFSVDKILLKSYPPIPIWTKFSTFSYSLWIKCTVFCFMLFSIWIRETHSWMTRSVLTVLLIVLGRFSSRTGPFSSLTSPNSKKTESGSLKSGLAWDRNNGWKKDWEKEENVSKKKK